MSFLSGILSSIRTLTVGAEHVAGLPADEFRLIAAGLLGLAGENGATAAPLDDLAREVEQPAAVVLAVLQALAAAGLLVLCLPELAGDAAARWVVLWWPGFAGAGVTVNVYSEAAGADDAAARAGGCLFVCSDPSPDLDHIKTNKQTAHAHARTREGGAGADDTGRIVALLTDPAVTAGLVTKAGAAVGCFRPEQAREIAGVIVRSGGTFGQVLGNVCQWRREVEAGRVFSPLPALRSRLGVNGRAMFDGSITAADRALPWYVAHDPAAWLPADDFPAAVGAPSVNNYSGAAGQDVAPAPSAPAPEWDRVLAALRLHSGQIADLLVDASAAPADDGGDRWVVRLGTAGAAWAGWLQAKAGRQVARALQVLAGGPVAAVEFRAAPAAGD